MILDFDPPIPLVRALFLEYSQELGIDLCFQNFQQELANLPDRYESLIVAYDGDLPAGCVGLRPFEPSVAEMKRLYVREQFRGTGLGRLLAVTAIRKAKELGYLSLRLDTLPSMVSAIALYRSLGFYEIQGVSKVYLLFFQLDF